MYFITLGVNTEYLYQVNHTQDAELEIDYLQGPF